MHTTNLSPSPTRTITAHRQARWTPGLHPANLIAPPRGDTQPAPTITPPDDPERLHSLFLAVADKLADIAAGIARMEIAHKAGFVSTDDAGRALLNTMFNLNRIQKL